MRSAERGWTGPAGAVGSSGGGIVIWGGRQCRPAGCNHGGIAALMQLLYFTKFFMSSRNCPIGYTCPEVMKLLILAAWCAAALLHAQDYALGPDSQPQA